MPSRQRPKGSTGGASALTPGPSPALRERGGNDDSYGQDLIALSRAAGERGHRLSAVCAVSVASAIQAVLLTQYRASSPVSDQDARRPRGSPAY